MPSAGPISGFTRIRAAPAAAPTSPPMMKTNKRNIGESLSRRSRLPRDDGVELDRAAQLTGLVDAGNRPRLRIRAFEPGELVRAALHTPARRRARELDAQLAAPPRAGAAAGG